MAKVFLSLGSSLGDRIKTLFNSIEDIENKIGTVLNISSVYETKPWGFTDENLFLNMAIEVYTNLEPLEILTQIHTIEKKYKRQRTPNKGYQARTLDIDIIFYDDIIYYNKNLQIPHKLAHKRNFVLVPIAEIAPNVVHPLLKQTINTLTQTCNDTLKIKKLQLV